jgi:hypothetical protein
MWRKDFDLIFERSDGDAAHHNITPVT